MHVTPLLPRTQCQRYLLSNLRYWLEEYQFDGFRCVHMCVRACVCVCLCVFACVVVGLEGS